MINKKNGYIFLSIFILINSFLSGVVALGSGPSSSPGGSLGSGSNEEIKSAFQAAQQVLQLVTQIVGNIKATLESNAQAENNRLAKINAPRLPEDPADSQVPEVKSIDVSPNSISVNFTGMELTLADRNTGNKIIVMNRANTTGTIITNSSLENTITSNTTTILTKNSQDLGVVRVEDMTLIDDGGAKIDSSLDRDIIVRGFLPFVSASEINGRVKEFSEQYILFVDENIIINGHDILFFPLKEYGVIDVNGSGLYLMEKDVDIIFNEDKTYFSRKVGESNFLINKIVNENNRDYYFSLVEGGSSGNYFKDSKLRLTVGEAVVKNPLDIYENVSIPKTRLEMWKKAV